MCHRRLACEKTAVVFFSGKSKSGRSGTSTKSAAHAPLPDSMTAAAAAAGEFPQQAQRGFSKQFQSVRLTLKVDALNIAFRVSATAQQMAELFGFYSSAQGGMFNPLTAAALMPGMFDPAAAHAMMMMMPPPPSSAEVAATRGRGGRGGRGRSAHCQQLLEDLSSVATRRHVSQVSEPKLCLAAGADAGRGGEEGGPGLSPRTRLNRGRQGAAAAGEDRPGAAGEPGAAGREGRSTWSAFCPSKTCSR